MRTNRAIGWALATLMAAGGSARAGLPDATPEDVGLDSAKLARVMAAVEESVSRGEVPGAVVIVGRHGKIAMAGAVGKRSLVPSEEAMTRDTVFDMASLTKPVATATSVMLLWQEGKIELGDAIGKHMPEFANHGKEAITVEQLLRHRAGLIPDNPIRDYEDGPEDAWKKLESIGLEAEPGERFWYSDVSFLLLGRLVEKVSGKKLEEFSKERVFGPLGMADTMFHPLRAGIEKGRIAPTESGDGEMLRGVVHDPRSRALGGSAGHAGLFGTADDLAVFAWMMLDGSNGKVLARPTVRAMMDASDTPEKERRGLGWDVSTSYSSPRGAKFGPRSFGHTGFTGTSLWADPETGMFVVLLTSRLHPDGKKPSPVALRRRVATLAAEAIAEPPFATGAVPEEHAAGDVACGIDVLERDGFAPLRGKRVGLVTNHTGRARDGRPTIDVLFGAADVQLVALFSPEHGIRGLVDEKVSDSTDEKTGLPIHSLYGETRKPTAKQMEGVDALVYDIQDIGARFYTYISTLVHVMEAAKERGVPVIVLDRPNPIGGIEVAGPVRDDGFESFIAIHDLPVRHGMTVGELAGMFNAERMIGADLRVVKCEGWERGMTYDRTGLEWVNPSPNMRSLTEAMLYPGVGLLEASNLATGRGTDTPFERVGATWIEPRAWAEALNGAGLPGVTFLPIRFTPTVRQYQGQDCGGVYVAVTDWSAFEPVSLAFVMARTLRELYPEQWKPEGFLKMLADQKAYDAMLEKKSLGAIRAGWAEELGAFKKRREGYLLY